MPRLATLALTAALLTAATSFPAHAQSSGFGVFFGDEESDFFERDFFPERITCMTDRQIRDDIAARGYTDVALNVAHEKRIEVRATRDGYVYLLDFNFCSGRILDEMRLRPAQ